MKLCATNTTKYRRVTLLDLFNRENLTLALLYTHAATYMQIVATAAVMAMPVESKNMQGSQLSSDKGRTVMSIEEAARFVGENCKHTESV